MNIKRKKKWYIRYLLYLYTVILGNTTPLYGDGYALNPNIACSITYVCTRAANDVLSETVIK